MQLKVAIPNKGRLSEASVALLNAAGVKVDYVNDRRLFATALNEEVMVLFVRADDIPEFVADGVADLGITGFDIISETGRPVEVALDLRFGRCKLVVAVPEDSKYSTIEDVPPGVRVATSFPNLTARYFKSHSKSVQIVSVSGAAEITPHIGVADIIADLVSTGSTLKMNHMRPIATILDSTARVVVRKDALSGKDSERLRELIWALESVVRARGKRYLMANVPRDRLSDVRKILPGISGPTIVDILVDGRQGPMVAAHAVVDEDELFRVVSDLKKIGAEGILVTPIERLMP
ncbi:MAG: ATP phosphoribosyltransferase [Euryarchaeota archaeon]|nr:ATP phosphoribosyltransferase [Euryarchaeota archaeon]